MLKKFLNKVLNNLIRYQEARVAYWQLQHMTDSQLKDIGINRSEIRKKVYG